MLKLTILTTALSSHTETDIQHISAMQKLTFLSTTHSVHAVPDIFD
jgi:hypothetical protein